MSGFCGRSAQEIRISQTCAHATARCESAKRKRQYEHIKRSATARGRSNKTAERIAAATTIFRDKLLALGRREGEDFEYVELADEGHGSADIQQKIRTFTILADYLERVL